MYRLGILLGVAYLGARQLRSAFYNGFDLRLHDWDTPLPDCEPEPRSHCEQAQILLATGLLRLLRH